MTLTEIAKKASSAALILAHLSTDKKNQALKKMAELLEENYNSIHNNSEYTDCNYDNDCISVWGHCDIGLGGCHYTINNQYPQNQINDLSEEWLNNNCTAGVCDCMGLPYAQCVNGICSPSKSFITV